MALVKTLRDNRATVVVGTVLVVAFAALLWALAPRSGEEGQLKALVHDGDGRVFALPLDEDARLEVVTSLGRNVIVVEDGAVRMAEADCPQGSCMAQHPASRPGEQVICLPHKLWIEVVDEGGASGSLDEDAVTWNEDVDFVSR